MHKVLGFWKDGLTFRFCYLKMNLKNDCIQYDMLDSRDITMTGKNIIIFLSMHLLRWINVMSDFICTGFAELWGTEREKCKMKMYIFGGIRYTAKAFKSQASALDRLTTRLTCIKNFLKTFTVSSIMIKINIRHV